MVLLAMAAGVAAALAAFGATLGDAERVVRYWAAAELSPGEPGQGDNTTTARITEVIDYDFGTEPRRGIFLDIADLDPTAPVQVYSPTAPHQFVLEPADGVGPMLRDGTRVRIGDPARTILGRHRYEVSYPLEIAGSQHVMMSWNAIGTHWEVDIGQAEVHLLAPVELHLRYCWWGPPESLNACEDFGLEVTQAGPGHLVVRADRIVVGTGITIDADLGATLPALPAVARPAGAVTDPGAGLALPTALAVLAALAGAAATSRMIRRAGRERVVVGGAADAAFGSQGPTQERLVDHAELPSLATIEVAPPPELTPSQGGVVLQEAVTDDHKVAWLIEAAIDGYVNLQERDGKPVLVRTGDGHGPTAARLAPVFEGRSELTLGSYDPAFAEVWSDVGADLASWKRTSGLWDPAGDRRRLVARILGGLAVVPAAALVVLGAGLANRWGPAWLVVAAPGGLLWGSASAALLRSWELKVRTPAGAAAWLRVESFRRFLAGSEAYHAQQAAERGVLREYTAWAVAVGEVRRWSKAVLAAGIPAAVAGASYAELAPSLASSSASTATPPSSNGGSGGGGGGGVGGGSGGSGGGSW